MVTIECSKCHTKKELPSTLTVTEDEIEGWEGEIEKVSDSKIYLSDFYCPFCSKKK